jgi:hypothetical protein
MKRLATLLLASIIVSSPTYADMSLVLGRALSQYDDVIIEDSPEETCPPEAICLWSWSRWTLNVKKTLKGPSVKGRIRVAMKQHSPYVRSVFTTTQLFLLEPIEDASERMRLHADYILREFSEPQTMYCTFTDPVSLGVSPGLVYKNRSEDDAHHCFPNPKDSEE